MDSFIADFVKNSQRPQKEELYVATQRHLGLSDEDFATVKKEVKFIANRVIRELNQGFISQPITYEVNVISPEIEHHRNMVLKRLAKHILTSLKTQGITIRHRKRPEDRVSLLVSEYVFSYFSSKTDSRVDGIIPHDNQNDTVIPNFLKNICMSGNKRLSPEQIRDVVEILDLSSVCNTEIDRLKCRKYSSDTPLTATGSTVFGYNFYYERDGCGYSYDISFDVLKRVKGRFDKYKVTHPHNQDFNSLLMCMLMRYDSLGSLNHQLAMPIKVREEFRQSTGVNFECFASPINAYYDNYCSMFYDIEKYFGSQGPIQNMTFLSGVFMANPPYEEKILSQLMTKIKEAPPEASFIFGMPKWDDYPFQPLLDALAYSNYSMVTEDYSMKWDNLLTGKSNTVPATYRLVVGDEKLFNQTQRVMRRWEADSK